MHCLSVAFILRLLVVVVVVVVVVAYKFTFATSCSLVILRWKHVIRRIVGPRELKDFLPILVHIKLLSLGHATWRSLSRWENSISLLVLGWVHSLRFGPFLLMEQSQLIQVRGARRCLGRRGLEGRKIIVQAMACLISAPSVNDVLQQW